MTDNGGFSISVAPAGKYTVANASTFSPYQWRWSIAPGCYFQVVSAPNRFHRFMQRVFLGLIWERIP